MHVRFLVMFMVVMALVVAVTEGLAPAWTIGAWVFGSLAVAAWRGWGAPEHPEVR